MDPAKGMQADGELAGIVADDHRPGQQIMRLDGAPERALGGDPRRPEAALHAADAEPLEMRGPGRLIRKTPLRVGGQRLDDRPGQGAIAHVGQRLGVDDIIGVAGAQQFEEVQPAPAGRGAEPGEVVVADLRAAAARAPVARPGVVHRDPRGMRQPGARHVAAFVKEALLVGDQQTHDLPLGNGDPDGA